MDLVVLVERAELGVGLVVVALLGALAAALGVRAGGPDTSDGRRSTYLTGPHGARGWATALEQLGVSVERYRRREPPAVPPPMLALLDPSRPVTPWSAAQLMILADSGADAFILFDSELVRSLSRAMNLNHFTLQTLGGTSRVQPVTLPALRVGGATWRDEIATVVPRPAGYPEAIDGLMPLHRLASVSFRRTESAIIVRHR